MVKHHWVPFVMPYFDQGNLSQSYNFTVDWDNAANFPVIVQNVPVFICPSATGALARGNVLVDANGVTLPAPLGVLDYGSINQVFPDFYLLNGIPAPADASGALQAALPTPIVQITDGTSNTVLLGEVAGGPMNFVFEQGQGVPAGGTKNGVGDWGWADSGFPYSINGADPTTGVIAKQTATTGNASCVVNCTNNGEIYAFHGGGANLLYADGSVHYITKSISLTTFAAIFHHRTSRRAGWKSI